MLPAGIAALVVGVIFLFVIPWVGIPIGVVGVALLIAYFVGASRRAAEPGS